MIIVHQENVVAAGNFLNHLLEPASPVSSGRFTRLTYGYPCSPSVSPLTSPNTDVEALSLPCIQLAGIRRPLVTFRRSVHPIQHMVPQVFRTFNTRTLNSN